MANIDQVQLPDGSQYHIIDDTSGYATTTYVQDQISTINKNTIGLGNVDNTADINKPVSLPQQAALNGKVDDDIVAYVESDTTATKRYEVGDQFILNGVLYTATAIIAVNDTIVIGTNCDSAESVATQITENANAIVSLRSDITSINQTGSTATQAISSGTYFYLNGVLVRAKTAIASGATFTLNTNYEVVTVGGAIDEVVEITEEITKSYGLKLPRQKNLGTFTTTAQLETFLSNMGVSTGTFDGNIQIGDYATIAGYKCIVAGFDTEFNKGNTALTTHHITFIANFGNSQMNSTNTTTGGYNGATVMQNFLSEKATEISGVLSSHLLTRPTLLTNSVGSDGKSNNWAWTNKQLTLLSETQIYGAIQWGNVYDIGEGYEKLPIFNELTPLQLFGRTRIWLRGVSSAAGFCDAGSYGYPDSGSASSSLAAVALFCIG